MSTTNSTKNKKRHNEMDTTKDRNYDKRSKQPLFEQFNDIVTNANQQYNQLNKKQGSSKKGSASVPGCDSESSHTTTNNKQKPSKPPHQISEVPPEYNSGSSYDETPRTTRPLPPNYDKGSSKMKTLSRQTSNEEPGYHNGSISAAISNDFHPNSQSRSIKNGSESDLVSDNEEYDDANREIKDSVESSSEDTNLEDNIDTKMEEKNDAKKRKSYVYQWSLSPILRSNLQWYARNSLFQRVKIIDESHLESGGQIIQDALEKLKIDKSSKHINAYINDCRQIIKRAMCSRRGYVKNEIGLKFKALIQNGQLSFELLELIDCLYKEEYENDPKVRKLWYLFCYHFLPRINKDWKHSLEGSRIMQPTFLYEKITTSDEAMTLWFIKNWEPKMKSQCDKGWPENLKKNKPTKGVKSGEQELRSGLADYIRFHNIISEFKDKEKGMVANRWNDIFWDELIVQNPNLFKKQPSNLEDQSDDISTESKQDEVLVLPGIDNKMNDQSINLLSCYNMRRAYKTNTESNSNSKQQHTNINTSDNGNETQDENNNNDTSSLFLDEIKNQVTV